MSGITLSPVAAAEAVCHEEQLRIWASDDMIGALALGDFLRGDLDYAEGIELERVVMAELKKIITAAFDHPEAKTFITKRRS
jgi:hypothetical protein